MVDENTSEVTKKKSGKAEAQGNKKIDWTAFSKEVGLNLMATSLAALITGFASAAGGHIFRTITRGSSGGDVIPLKRNG